MRLHCGEEYCKFLSSGEKVSILGLYLIFQARLSPRIKYYAPETLCFQSIIISKILAQYWNYALKTLCLQSIIILSYEIC